VRPFGPVVLFRELNFKNVIGFLLWVREVVAYESLGGLFSGEAISLVESSSL